MPDPISMRDGAFAISDLTVTDDVAVAYVSQHEPELRQSAVVNCIQLGARALTFASDQSNAALVVDALRQSTDTTSQALNHISRLAQQSVERSTEALGKNVGQLLLTLTKDLERSLDPANAASIIGKLRNALLDDYRKVTSKVREELDLGNPLSPLAVLRSELEKSDERRFEALSTKVTQLLEQQAAKVAAHRERLKSTRKGIDLEAATEEFLSSECRPRKDLVRKTATEAGFDNNNVGDFVIEINPSDGRGLRIVIETKNANKGTTALTRELDKAMKNRCAAFGIAVVTDAAPITQAIVPFGDDKLLVRVPALADGDEWDFTALAVALECARWKSIMARSAGDLLDVNRIRADIEAALMSTNRFIEAKKRITACKTSLDGLAEYLDEIRRDMQTILQRIRDGLCDPQNKAA